MRELIQYLNGTEEHIFIFYCFTLHYVI